MVTVTATAAVVSVGSGRRRRRRLVRSVVATAASAVPIFVAFRSAMYYNI